MSTSPALLENGCGYQLENTLYPNVQSIVALYYSTHVYSRPNICRRCSKVVFLFFYFFSKCIISDNSGLCARPVLTTKLKHRILEV